MQTSFKWTSLLLTCRNFSCKSGSIVNHCYYFIISKWDIRSSHVYLHFVHLYIRWGPSLSWSYGSWIYNYLCNQCLSPLSCEFESRSWRDVLDTTLWDKVCQWFSPGTTVSSTNKTDCHGIKTYNFKSEVYKEQYHLFINFMKKACRDVPHNSSSKCQYTDIHVMT